MKIYCEKDYNNNKYYISKLSLCNIFVSPFENVYFKRKIRFFLLSIKRSIAFLLIINNQIIGYSLFERGGGRYSFSRKEDWILSRHAIKEDFRGQGYGKKLLLDSICFFKSCFSGSLYSLVVNTHNVSIKAFSHSDFGIVGKAINKKGIFRKYIQNSEGNYFIYKLKNE